MEDEPHTGVMKGLITDRTRYDLMAFEAAQVDARLRRREVVFAVGRAGLFQTLPMSWLYVVSLRVLRLRRLWIRLI